MDIPYSLQRAAGVLRVGPSKFNDIGTISFGVWAKSNPFGTRGWETSNLKAWKGEKNVEKDQGEGGGGSLGVRGSGRKIGT